MASFVFLALEHTSGLETCDMAFFMDGEIGYVSLSVKWYVFLNARCPGRQE